MAYVTYTDISSEFRNTIFTTTSDITIAEVTTFITEYEAYVNTKISTLYTTPLDASYTDAINILKIIVKKFVVAKIKRILSSDSTEQSIKERSIASLYEKKAEEMLNDIVNGTIELTGVSRSTGIPTSYNYENDETAIFEKGTDQW